MQTKKMTLKSKLFFMRRDLIFKDALSKGLILPFEEELYERLHHIYVNGLPLDIELKYFKPSQNMDGRCYDRSLFLTMAFSDAMLVRGNLKDLELIYGEELSGHSWVEKDGWIYDPSTLLKMKKEVFDKMYLPKNVVRLGIKEYESDTYREIKDTNIDDLRPNGKYWYRIDLFMQQYIHIAKFMSKEFQTDLEAHLKEIDYNPALVQESRRNWVKQMPIGKVV